MPFLDRDGTKIAYEAAGPDAIERARQAASGGGGPRAIVFLHNIFCDRRVFTFPMAVLQSRFRTIGIDLRGHGESPVPRRRYDIADLVDDVIAVMDAENVATAVLVGVSLGATVAMELALGHPDRVERLVLMGADADKDSGVASARNALFCRVVRATGIRSLVLGQVEKNLFGETFRREGGELYRLFRGRLASFDRRGAALAMQAWTGRRSLLRPLTQVQIPTLVLVGQEDVSCPLPCGEKIAAAIPGCSLVQIPAAGHTMPAERPRDTTTALQTFLGIAP